MNNNFYYTEYQKELNESYDDGFYIEELLDKLEDNRRAIEIYTIDITQPDEEYALTQEEKDRTIKMLKEYYKQAKEKEEILGSILDEAEDIYNSYKEIVRQEKVMIEDAFEKLGISLDEAYSYSDFSKVLLKPGKPLNFKDKAALKTLSKPRFDKEMQTIKKYNDKNQALKEDVYDDVKKKFKDTYLSGDTKENDSAKEFKKSGTIDTEVKNVRQDMKNLADYLDRWYEKNIAHQYGMAVDLSGFDEQAFLNFRNSLSLSPEETSQLDKFRNESLKEDVDGQHYVQTYNDYISGLIDNMPDDDIDDNLKFFNRFARALHTKAAKLVVETVSDDNYEEIDMIDAIKYEVEDNATELPATGAYLHTFDDFAVVIEELPWGDVIWAKSEDDLNKFWNIATEKYNKINN